jgi:hypothetical protein
MASQFFGRVLASPYFMIGDVNPEFWILTFLPIPDPGVKKAPDPGSGSATRPVDKIKRETFSYNKRGT